MATAFAGIQDKTSEVERMESLARHTDRIALRAGWIVGVLLALLVLLLNLDRNPIPLLEDHLSFGPLSLYVLTLAAFVAAWITFVMGVKEWNRRVTADRQRNWKLQVLPISLAYTLLVVLTTIVVLQLAEPAFPGLALDRFQAAFVGGLAGATLIYWLVTQTMQINSSRLLRLAIIVVAAGVYLAISSSDDPLWWQISFSSVGTHKTFTSWVFNTSLVFGGVLLLVWLPYFSNDFQILVRHGLSTQEKAKWVRTGLIALGIAIGLVGIFENRVSQVTDMIHNLAAPTMGVIVIVLALSVRRLIPGFPREVYVTSFFLAALLIVGVFFVMIGYFNTAGITIYGAAIAFTWLTLFTGVVEQTAQDLEPDAFPT